MVEFLKVWEKTIVFYPYTLLYLNYHFYRKLTKRDFQLCYRNRLIVVNFLTLSRKVKEIEFERMNKKEEEGMTNLNPKHTPTKPLINTHHERNGKGI